MSNHSPITPPNGLLDHCCAVGMAGNWHNALTIACQAGADQELEACCEWLFENDYDVAPVCLRAARRPKPPSLKEQALSELEILSDYAHGLGCSESAIRRALEQLDD